MWICIPLILAGFVAMFVNLPLKPFWADESIAVLPARNIHSDLVPTSPFDLDFMPWQIKNGLWDPATPLYRYSVAAFTAVTGFSELTARGFSILMGLALVFPFAALVRRMYDSKTALIATTLLVTSSSFMVFAREARHFTFVAFLAVCTLYYLHRAAQAPRDESSPLWVVFLTATLLSQTLGYALLPLAALYVVLNQPRRFFARRHIATYLIAAAVYLAILVPFWSTLPFFHDNSCANRPVGCQQSPWYYLGVLHEFLVPMQERHPWEFWTVLSLPPLFFLLGLALTLHATLTRRLAWQTTSLLLLWLLVPLLLLSSRDVKFPRYLFIWAMPLCALFMAVAVQWIAGLRPFRRGPGLVAAGLLALIVLSPQLTTENRWGAADRRVRSGLISYLNEHILDTREDNWELIRWQAEYLKPQLHPDDVVVASFDDATLQYYLGRFVYGFLNSTRTDAFFLELLAEAERRGATLWLMDTLPRHNYCLTDEAEPRHLDCREKYPLFYQRCAGADEQRSSSCVRIPVYQRRTT